MNSNAMTVGQQHYPYLKRIECVWVHQPWEQYQMTESEWREYEDEYADWLDSLKETK
jgi:hypothetical protein